MLVLRGIMQRTHTHCKLRSTFITVTLKVLGEWNLCNWICFSFSQYFCLIFFPFTSSYLKNFCLRCSTFIIGWILGNNYLWENCSYCHISPDDQIFEISNILLKLKCTRNFLFNAVLGWIHLLCACFYAHIWHTFCHFRSIIIIGEMDEIVYIELNSTFFLPSI